MNENNNDREITGKIKLRIDKDFEKLLKMSEKTGVPLTFRGDRIIDFKVEGIPDKINIIKPDQIKIGPPSFLFDIKIGHDKFKNVPFDRIKIDEDTVIFKSMFYSELDINLKIKFKLDNINYNATLNITINPKSNKINDILNYEIRKRELSNETFQLIPFGDINSKIETKLPTYIYDDAELEFYKKVNYINKKLKLDINIKDDYIINNSDFECANMICDYINSKKIKIDNISLSMKTPVSMLHEFITKDKRPMLLKQNEYLIELLGNKINLGSCKVELKEYEILNYNKLKEIYDNNIHNKELISVSAILKDYSSDELYLDFNID